MPRPPRSIASAAVAAALLAASASPAGAQEPLPPLPASSPTAPPPPPPTAPASGPRGVQASPVFTPRGAPSGGELTLRFETEEPGIELLVRDGQTLVSTLQRYRRSWWTTTRVVGLYAPLCLDACVTRVPRGEYRFALSKDGGRAVPVAPVAIEQPSLLHAQYIDRSGYRTAGAIVGVGGVLGGIALVAASFAAGKGDHVDGPMLGGGIGLIVSSAIVGSILGLQRDSARLHVAPSAEP